MQYLQGYLLNSCGAPRARTKEQAVSILINKIEIKNFRSIRHLNFEPGELGILVGKNDSGKSNILRAINLFFNGETDSNQKLIFENDFNADVSPKQRAKEISVTVHFEVPDSYKATNGDIVTWSKSWRKTGVHDDFVEGFRRKKNKKANLYPVKISAKSNIYALLNKVRYIYVPAVKDSQYFSRLRSQIYGIIAEVASTDFKTSSKDFEKSISDQTRALTDNISREMGFSSRLAMPKDLSHIFERLDFLGEENQISLDYRGDGIKARHIPMILKFMADRTHELSGRGAQPYSFIWGYEEPENNLEITNCIKMADQFWSFINHGIDQILVTTHSPVFYGQKDTDVDRLNGNRISCHYISRGNAEEGTKANSDAGDADRELGFLTIIEPKIRDIRKQLISDAAAQADALRAKEDHEAVLYVEGPSDKIILKKALELFSPSLSSKIRVDCAQRGGFQYVVDRLHAWHNIKKHEPHLPKHVGLIDGESTALDYLRKHSSDWKKKNNVRCFSLADFDPFASSKSTALITPRVLEIFYSDEIWAAETDIIELQPTHYLTASALNEIAHRTKNLSDLLDPVWTKRATSSISSERKVPLARHIATLPNEQAKSAVIHLEQVVGGIVDFLSL
jgi:predicted ATP-dependent endonuclease of OLD family